MSEKIRTEMTVQWNGRIHCPDKMIPISDITFMEIEWSNARSFHRKYQQQMLDALNEAIKPYLREDIWKFSIDHAFIVNRVDTPIT